MKIFIYGMALFISSHAYGAEMSAIDFRGGILYFDEFLPMPAVTGSLDLGNNFHAEGTLATFIVEGSADLGIRYELPQIGVVTPAFSLRIGGNYSLTDSSRFVAPAIGFKFDRYHIEAAPVWYFKRYFRHVSSNDIEKIFLISVMMELER